MKNFRYLPILPVKTKKVSVKNSENRQKSGRKNHFLPVKFMTNHTREKKIMPVKKSEKGTLERKKAPVKKEEQKKL